MPHNQFTLTGLQGLVVLPQSLAIEQFAKQECNDVLLCYVLPSELMRFSYGNHTIVDTVSSISTIVSLILGILRDTCVNVKFHCFC